MTPFTVYRIILNEYLFFYKFLIPAEKAFSPFPLFLLPATSFLFHCIFGGILYRSFDHFWLTRGGLTKIDWLGDNPFAVILTMPPFVNFPAFYFTALLRSLIRYTPSVNFPAVVKREIYFSHSKVKGAYLYSSLFPPILSFRKSKVPFHSEMYEKRNSRLALYRKCRCAFVLPLSGFYTYAIL